VHKLNNKYKQKGLKMAQMQTYKINDRSIAVLDTALNTEMLIIDGKITEFNKYKNINEFKRLQTMIYARQYQRCN
jgi:hypothetical protein